MTLKHFQFFDYPSSVGNPISIGTNLDRGKNDVYFQLDMFLPKSKMNFEKHTNLSATVDQSVSKHINLLLPDLINYNMELFAVGNLNLNEVTEYVILFKPWLVSNVDMGRFTPYIENFIYVIPYRILTSLLAHGIRQSVFSLNSLRTCWEIMFGFADQSVAA